MKKMGLLIIAAAVITGSLLSLWPTHSGAAFNQNRIIDDGIFNNFQSMGTDQINNFLNQFPNSCISPNKGFSAPLPTGYSPSGGYQYNAGNATAGEVISTAAQAYEINPQVLLATLQKEQALVTGGAGCTPKRYVAAVGYGCPDSGGSYSYSGGNFYSINGVMVTSIASTCVNSATKAGFSQQIIRAAWMLKFSQQRSLGNVNWAIIKGDWNNSDDPQSCYSGPMTQGYHRICPSGPITYYDGLRSIDGVTVQMESGATAALYRYTPHLHGNQLFVSTFENWFGPTNAPNYAWQPLSQGVYTDSTKTQAHGWGATLVAGQTAYVSITVRNTGNQTWHKSGANAVRIAPWNPQDRNSAFCYQWISCNRAAVMNEDTVVPGATATFEFPIKAPTDWARLYRENFNLVAEGRSWFSNAGQFFDLNVVPPTYTWTSINQRTYTDQSRTTLLGWNAENLEPGQRVFVVVSAKNTGNQTWHKSGANPVRLGTWNPQDQVSQFCSNWQSCNRAAEPNETTIAPGETATFEFWMQAPAQPGNHRQYFNLVAEGKTWMNNFGMYIGLNIPTPNLSWQPAGQGIYTDNSKTTVLGWDATLKPNQQAHAVVKVKNTSNVKWKKNDSNFPTILVGTWNPQDRNSAFCYQWISCNRAAVMNEDTVVPGATATFEFPIKAPTQPGTYHEYFNVVAEGKTWLNPTGQFFTLIVQ